MDYYNEIDPFCAEWLQNLMDADVIGKGVIDTRSIEDVTINDIRGHTQVHFFAGIGVWSYALRQAGWPVDRPVWTGSCPCQPFSAAGKGGGFADERHLWPSWLWLIRGSRPDTLFGEQVSSKDGLAWLDIVSDDMAGEGYSFGAMDICSASVGAPNIRQRQYFVGLADTDGWNASAEGIQRSWEHRQQPSNSGVANTDSCVLGPVNGFWRDADWLRCRDESWRPVEPGTFPLVTGATGRVGRLRAYGNAINAEVAIAWIEAFLDVEADGFVEVD